MATKKAGLIETDHMMGQLGDPMPEMTVSSTVLRRHIGRRFEALRRRADLTVDKAAKLIDKGRSTLMRIEQGDELVRFRAPDVETMLKVYSATQQESEILLALTAETRNGTRAGWWTASSMPSWFDLYVALEDAAETIMDYESELIPGLLQTRAYAEHLFRVGLSDEDEVQRLLAIRMERQSLLARSTAPHLSVVLNEAVLRRPVGSATTMADQLAHVLDVAGQRDNVSVRVIPFSVGVHGGMAGSAFYILEFPTGPGGMPLEPTLAYIDTFTDAVYANEPDKVRVYQNAWDDLMKKALDVSASRQLITEARKGFSGE